MSFPQEESLPAAGTCPFLDEPCPQGVAQGLQCQLRVAQDFDPVAHFHDFEVIYCAMCRREIRRADLVRAITAVRLS
jgi:hypothetical protein